MSDKKAEYTRSLIEASLDPLVSISPKGKITDVNEATVKVTGVTRRKLIGSDFSDYFTNRARPRKGYQKVFSHGLVSDYALTIRHFDGHLTDVLYNATLYRDTRGEVLGVFGAARHIIAQKREAERARNADHRFRATFEAAPTAIILVDKRGRLSRVNASMEKLFGYSRKQLPGFSVEQLVPPRFRASHPAMCADYFLAPENRPMGAGRELFGLRKDALSFRWR